MPRSFSLRIRVSAIVLFAFTLSVALSAAGNPNVSQAPSLFTPKRASEAHLYWHFLLYQNYLDRQAVIRQKQGKDGLALRDHFQRRLQFTDSQYGVVRQAGLQLEADLKIESAKAAPIIALDRQWIKLHGRSAGPPPGHSQVQQLQKEREAVITNAVEQLNQALGPQTSAKFQTFIDTEWAPHVTVHTVHARPHDPKHNPVVPLHMEARQ
jgi:hypothetical protein